MIRDGYDLGVALGVPRSELAKIYTEDNRESVVAKQAMFTLWLHNTDNPTWSHVAMAAYTVNHSNLALQMLLKYESNLF